MAGFLIRILKHEFWLRNQPCILETNMLDMPVVKIETAQVTWIYEMAFHIDPKIKL